MWRCEPFSCVPAVPSAPSRVEVVSRQGWSCVSVQTASGSMIWAARSTTSRQIVSSAIPSRAPLTPTGAQTPGARYARKRSSFLPFRIASFRTLAAFRVFEDNRGARAPEKVCSLPLFSSFKPPPLPAPQLFLKMFGEFLFQLGARDVLTRKTPKKTLQYHRILQWQLRPLEHLSPSHPKKKIVEPCISISKNSGSLCIAIKVSFIKYCR